MNSRSYAAPVVVLLMALPIAYVAGYFALVNPKLPVITLTPNIDGPPEQKGDYRFRSGICDRVFWPIETVDRKLRPRAWHWQKSKLYW